MNIHPPCVVALTWTLQDSLGETLDQLDEPVDFFVGGNDLLPVIEQALLEQATGNQLDLNLEPSDAFGDYDAQKVFVLPRKPLPDSLEPGMLLEVGALPKNFRPDIAKETLLTITELYPDHVVVDGNHPLAGIGLRLHLSIHAVREATADETRRGSAGAGFFKL